MLLVSSLKITIRYLKQSSKLNKVFNSAPIGYCPVGALNTYFAASLNSVACKSSELVPIKSLKSPVSALKLISRV